MKGTKKGVYFLANDVVIEPVIAFLNSLRNSNPDIELCLIPYDQNFQRVLSLQSDYNFSVFDNEDLLQRCDVISQKFHGKTLGAYRKLVIWEGGFDQFIYIDVDTVVLRNVDFVFNCLSHVDILTSHSNIPDIIKWVWKDSMLALNALSEDQISFSANTGFISSRKGLLSVEVAEQRLAEALKLKDHMELHCMEQPFLNFLIVTSELAYTSLLNMTLSGEAKEIMLEKWAGVEDLITNGGQLIDSHLDNKIFLIHWAGVWLGAQFKDYDTMPFRDIWHHYRNFREAKFLERI